MTHNNTSTNAFLIHISAFAGLVFPFGNIIIPLIAWQTLKERDPFLDKQGKEAVNFNLSYTLYLFLISLSIAPFAFKNIMTNNFNILNLFGFGTVVGLIYLIGIALVIIAALKAKEGENYSYPFTINFLK